MTVNNDLTDRVALVTGASRGLGAGIAVALARAGCHVAVNYLSSEAGARETCAAVEAQGRRALPVRADVAQGGAVRDMVARVAAELGPVDVLVNNAGLIRPQQLEEITEADWHDLIAVNLTSAFLCTQAVLPAMRERKWGRIVNVSSLAAQVGGLVGPHYSAAKAGMLGLTHAYAIALLKEGITCNAVAPALIETDMVRTNPRAKPELVPVGRFGTAEEHADVVVTLVRNGYVTGQTYNVNGGMYFS